MDNHYRVPGSYPVPPGNGYPAYPQPAQQNFYDYSRPGHTPQNSGMGPRNGKRRVVYTIAIVLLVCALLTTGASFAFCRADTIGGLSGNAGIVAVCGYFRDFNRRSEETAIRMEQEIVSRIGAEPFEMESSFKLKPDTLEKGSPIDSLSVSIDAKYDMKDLGAKVSVLGIEAIRAYLIDDDLVVGVGDKAGSEKIDLPFSKSLGQSMPLLERALAFLPSLKENVKDIPMRLLQKIALSVPDEYTKTYADDVFSPIENKRLPMNVIQTTLDEEAFAAVLQNLSDCLKEDETLCDDIQALLDEISTFFNMDDIEFDDVVSKLPDLTDKDDFKDAELSWSVYEKNGRYIGLSVKLTKSGDNSGSLSMLSMYNGNTSYEEFKMSTGEMEILSSSTTVIKGNRIETTLETSAQADMYDQKAHQSSSIEYTREGSNDYHVEFDSMIETKTDYGDIMSDYGDTDQTFSLSGKADFLFGNDLGTLKESPIWNKIYDMEWGDLEDALENLESFGSLLGNTLQNVAKI